jgi:hypothetical protein
VYVYVSVLAVRGGQIADRIDCRNTVPHDDDRLVIDETADGGIEDWASVDERPRHAVSLAV